MENAVHHLRVSIFQLDKEESIIMWVIIMLCHILKPKRLGKLLAIKAKWHWGLYDLYIFICYIKLSFFF